jgi:nitroimidazol reductase NimA-like FMN-containing flavoprotein (pyridoxamine 5'-phosphate oxidase superfamily)
MSSPVRSSDRFRSLDEAECRELLAARHAGRVAWNAPDGPQVLPITYRMYAGRVVFRTSPYGVISQLVRRTKVAFEIDEIDEVARVGWSVVVRGWAEAVKHDYDLETLWRTETDVPWATGNRNLYIEIAPANISGRAVRAPD